MSDEKKFDEDVYGNIDKSNDLAEENAAAMNKDTAEEHSTEEPKEEEPKEEEQEEQEGTKGEGKADSEGETGDDNSAEEPKEEAKEEKAEEQFSAKTIFRAAKLGISEEELAEFSGDAEATKAFDVLERRMSKDSGEKQEGNREMIKPDDLDVFNPEQYDEEVVKFAGAVKGRFQQMQNENRFLSDQLARVETLYATMAYEQFLSALPEEQKNLFGTGPGDALDQKSKEFQNRKKVWSAAAELVQVARKKGEMAVPSHSFFKKALHAAFGEELTKLAKKSVVNGIHKRNGSSVSRPTHRSTMETDNPIDRAARIFDEKKNSFTR